MAFIPNECFGVNLVRGTPDGDKHAQRHMDLCNSIDMISIGVLLNEMVRDCHISQRQADAFQAQAGGLLATLLTENHRAFIGSPSQSTAQTVRRYGAYPGEQP